MTDRLEFIDSHVHFYDFKHDKLVWSWLAPDVDHPLIGNIDAIKAIRFRVENFAAETRFCNVVGAVHVQAAIGSDDPVDETAWIQSQHDEGVLPLAIVGDARMQAADVESQLERHAQFSMMRGIRDFAQGDYLVDPDFHRGYALLEKYNLAYDLDCLWENMAKAGDLAMKFPNIRLVLGHAGFPQERDDQYFANWRDGMRRLAAADNAVCKISGLGMRDPAWTVESIRPWVLASIEAFGVDRCMFGTNWPVDRLFSSYVDVVDAYHEIVADFSDEEKRQLFSGNARTYYRM